MDYLEKLKEVENLGESLTIIAPRGIYALLNKS